MNTDNNQNKEMKEKTEKKKKKDDLFKSKINFQLWGLFSMYQRLSLSDLSKHLGKSKSTIHPYIKDYLQREIIEVKEEIKVRGNIKAKIYGFKKGYDERIFSCDKDKDCLSKIERKEIDKEFGNKILKENIMKTKLQIKTLDTQLAFFEKLLNSGINGPDERALEVLKKIYKMNPDSEGGKDVYSITAYNSKVSHELLHNMMNELLKKFNEATAGEEKEFPDLEKPYHFLAFGMPLKMMMEYLKS